MTVKSFLEQHPSEAICLMTPLGYVNLTAESIPKLLQGQSIYSHLGVSGSQQEISSAEILEQEFCQEPKKEQDIWYAMTQSPAPAMSMQMQSM